MAYTSKHTGGQIEEKLDEIFASKLQEKAVEIVDNGATEVSADEGFLGLGKVSINVAIPNEEKTIEITENGTTEVVADNGFLNKVIVNTNVASSGGGGGGSSEEKVGMVYITKEALFQGLGTPMPDTMTQEEFKDFIFQTISTFAIVATRRDGDRCETIQAFYENVTESRITFDSWDAVAINFDQLVFAGDGGYMPMWRMFGPSFEAAKTLVSQIFPNQLTQEEFLQ